MNTLTLRFMILVMIVDGGVLLSRRRVMVSGRNLWRLNVGLVDGDTLNRRSRLTVLLSMVWTFRRLLILVLWIRLSCVRRVLAGRVLKLRSVI